MSRMEEQRNRDMRKMRARREQRRRRRRKKKLLRAAILCGLFLALVLLIAGIAAAVHGIVKGNGGSEEKPAKDIAIESGKTETDKEASEGAEEKGGDTSTGNDGEGEEDIRTVKNTATEEHHKTNGLAICMYHYVYDEADPPDDLNNNYIEVHALEEEIKYLVENDYYFPTWEEVRQYVEGDLLLPEKSVVLTFDDGAKSFLELGMPLFDKYKVPATSFMITGGDNDAANKVKKYQSRYVTYQSHSHDMHRGGGNIGHGGIFTAMSHDDAVADLKKSIEICGHGNAFAYPYGDYTDDCRTAVQDAGFTCAVTTENRRAEVGDDPLLLPRVRMSLGQSLESFIALVE